jgi:hypothetical protein
LAGFEVTAEGKQQIKSRREVHLLGVRQRFAFTYLGMEKTICYFLRRRIQVEHRFPERLASTGVVVRHLAKRSNTENERALQNGAPRLVHCAAGWIGCEQMPPVGEPGDGREETWSRPPPEGIGAPPGWFLLPGKFYRTARRCTKLRAGGHNRKGRSTSGHEKRVWGYVSTSKVRPKSPPQ